VLSVAWLWIVFVVFAPSTEEGGTIDNAPDTGAYIEVNGERYDGQRLVDWCRGTAFIRKDYRKAFKSASEYAEADEICASIGE
jgi:hypothetical protein